MATPVHGNEFTIRVEKRRRVPTANANGEPTGFTTVSDGYRDCRVIVSVDLAGLAERYGHRAVHSQRGKATACGGLVVVRFTGGGK